MLIRICFVLVALQIWCSASLVFSNSSEKQDSLTAKLETTTLIPLKADLHIQIGNLDLINNPNKALEHFNEAVLISKEAQYGLGLAQSYLGIGDYYFYVLDSFQLSLDYYERSLDVFLKEKDRDGIMLGYYKVGYTDFVLLNYDRAIKFIEVALYYSEELGNDLFTIKALNSLGLLHKNNNNFPMAISRFERALSISKKENNLEFIPKVLKNLGNAYRHLGYYSLAFKYYLESLEIYRASGDSIALADNLHNLGQLHHGLDNLDKAFEYKLEAYHIRLKVNSHPFYIGESLAGIGKIYEMRGNYQTAMDYYKKSLEYYKKSNRYPPILTGYANMGIVSSLMGNYNDAIKYLNKALALNVREGIGGADNYGRILTNIARTYYMQGNNDQALKYVKKGFTSELSAIGKREATILLSEIYVQQGNFQKAFEWYRVYTHIKDSIATMKKERDIQEFQTLHEVNKQNKEIELLKKEKEITLLTSRAEIKKQKTFRNAFILSGIALLIIVALILSRYRLKHKANLLLTTKNQQIEDQNTHILDSITYAKRIQDAILTSDPYMDGALGEYFVFYRPKDIVSGDFYWVYELNPNNVMVAVADCTGHGVPGAFMSMIGNALLNEIIIENANEEVEQILFSMRAHLIKALHHDIQTNKSMDGMDITLVKIDKKNLKLSFASAGHRLYHIRDGQCMDYKGDPFPVGAYYGREQPFSLHEIDILKGDSIYLTTDGFTDQFGGPNRKKYGLYNFKELVLSNHYSPMQKQKNNFINAFEEWKGDHSQIDDVCVMGIRI